MTSSQALSNPLFVAVVAGALGLFSNALVAYVNGKNAQATEEARVRGNLILEAIKTGDTKTAAANLKFLASAGLIQADAILTTAIDSAVVGASRGNGPALPAANEPSLASVAPAVEPPLSAERIQAAAAASIRDLTSTRRRAAQAQLVALASQGELEKQVVTGACLSSLAGLDDHYLTDLYCLLTLGDLPGGWCGTEDDLKRVEDVKKNADPGTVDAAFLSGLAKAHDAYRGPCDKIPTK